MKLTVDEALKLVENAHTNYRLPNNRNEVIGHLVSHMTDAEYGDLMQVLHDLNIKPNCSVCKALAEDQDAQEDQTHEG